MVYENTLPNSGLMIRYVHGPPPCHRNYQKDTTDTKTGTHFVNVGHQKIYKLRVSPGLLYSIKNGEDCKILPEVLRLLLSRVYESTIVTFFKPSYEKSI